jgi:hypothetical protein
MVYVDGCLQVATASLNQAWRLEEAPSSKQQRLGLRISHLDMSWLGCVLVATDTQGQLYLYRLLPISEPGTTLPVSFLTVYSMSLSSAVSYGSKIFVTVSFIALS